MEVLVIKPPVVEIIGDGQGAQITSNIELNSSLPSFGQVTGFTIVSGGMGYDMDTTQIRILGGFPLVKPGGETAVVEVRLERIEARYCGSSVSTNL